MDRRHFVRTSASIAIAAPALLLQPSANGAAPNPNQPAGITIYVKDMHCAGCAKKIAAKLYTIKGVASVKTDLQRHMAVIQPARQQEPSLKQIWEAVEAVEFEPVKLVVNQQTYTKKPTQ